MHTFCPNTYRRVRCAVGALLSFSMLFSMTACVPTTPQGATDLLSPTPIEQSSATPAVASTPTANPSLYYAPFSPNITASIFAQTNTAMVFPQNDTWDNNVWTRAYQEKLGVTFERVFSGEPSELEDTLESLIASGSIPDYMVLPYDVFYKLANRNLLEPLNDAVSVYAHETVRSALDAYDGAARTLGTVKGSLYGITSAPARDGDMLWYRDDWMQASGRTKAPATFEEVLEMAYDFSKDPMKTGKPTVGLGLDSGLFTSENGNPMGLDGFFSAYGAYPTQWQEVDGEIQHGSLHDDAKIALEQLQKLVGDGVLDKQFASLDPWSDTLTGIYEDRIGMLLAPAWFSDWMESNRQTPRTKDTPTWTCIAIPGMSGSPNRVPTQNKQGDVTCVRAGYAYPELAVKMVNLTQGLLSGDIAEPQYTSMQGDGDFFISTAELAMAAGGAMTDGRKGEYAAAVQRALQAGNDTDLTGDAKYLYNRCKSWQEGTDLTSYNIFSQFGPGGSQAVLADMRARGLLMPNAYYGPNIETSIEHSADWIALMGKRNEIYRMIIGGAGAEKTFDTYTRFFQDNGGKEITRTVNDWFAAQ